MKVKNQTCIRRLSFRALKASRKKNIIAVTAIALTTLLFTALFTIALSLNNSYQTYTFRQIGGYCHGTFKEVNEDQIAAISAHPNVRETGRRTVIGYINTGKFAKVPAEVSYMDKNCTKWSYAEPVEGHMPEQEKEITMDTGSLKLLGITPEVGTQITLTWTVGSQDSLSYEKTDTFTLAGWWEYDDLSPVHYINISQDYAKAIEAEASNKGIEPFRTDLNVMMKSSVNIRGQMEQVDSDLGYDWESRDLENSVRIGVNWGYTSSQLGERIDPETILSIIAFLVLIIFTGYLIIYNIFQISVTEDIRFYGLLKTIGVTPRQLRRIIRWQALLLCIIGIPAGLILGYGVGAVLTPVVMKRMTLGAVSTSLSSSPLIFLGAALFSLITVIFSCFRPGRIAGKVSPVEAAKFTSKQNTRKKKRSTRGAKIHQMAFANLGRNKVKTLLVIVSLSLSVVLLNVLVTFVSGFDIDRYLAQKTCADFIVSNTDYFRSNGESGECITEDTISKIRKNTTSTLSGCGYAPLNRPDFWMTEEAWRELAGNYLTEEEMEQELKFYPEKNGLIGVSVLLEGLDDALFDKLNILEGDIQPLLSPDNHAIALAVPTDDYGNASVPDSYPAIGDILTLTYVDEAYVIDNRTGEPCDESTPDEYLEYYIAKEHDVTYTVCAYITVPDSMSYRFSTLGYEAIISSQALQEDSKQEIHSLFYLFDTPDSQSELAAEKYLADLTGGDLSEIMYESKATARADFEGFQKMFLIVGGLLCAIIGLVGILNFFNAIMTGILSRKREFAVLQSIGMTNRQLKKMLIYEGLFYALASSAAALILSVLLYPLLGNLLETMFWFFRAHFTVLPVMITIPVFAFLGFGIPSVIYHHTGKQSIVDRLREAV